MSVNNILDTKFCFTTALTSVGSVRLCVRYRRYFYSASWVFIFRRVLNDLQTKCKSARLINILFHVYNFSYFTISISVTAD